MDVSEIERLSGLCRVWGALKLFHPWLAYREIDWDAALVETIPLVQHAESTEDYRQAIEHLLAVLGDPSTHTVAPRRDGAGNSGTAVVPAPLGSPTEPRLHWTDDRIAILAARDLLALERQPHLQGVLDRLVAEAAGAAALVLDLREAGSYLRLLLPQSLGAVVEGTVLLPTVRSRLHSGFVGDSLIRGGGLYSSGWRVQEAEAIPGRAAPGAGKPLAVIVTGDVSYIAVAAGLQAAGIATLIAVGDIREPGPTDEVALAEGLTVIVRTGELLYADSTTGVLADVVVDDAASEDDALDSPAVTAALEAVRQSGRSQPTRRPAPTITPWRRERGYDQMAEPSLAYRLLALFRLWNAVHYFFPYKELMDRPWEDYLPAFLPRFAAAGDALAYATSVAEAAAWLQDSHAGVQSAVLDRHLGTHVPALQVQWIEGQSVVTRVLPDVLPTSVVAVGDVVVAVDGAPVQVRREHLGRLRAASTPQALAWLVHRRLLAGPEGSQAEIGVRKPGGEEARVTLPRVYPFAAAPFPPSRPVFSVLQEGYGYVDLTQLTVPQVDAAFEAIRQTPAVIFDMRGQSHGVFWLLARRLGTHSVPATRFRIPEPRGPSPDTVGAWTGVQWTLPSRNPWTIVQWTPPSSGWRYTGRVVVLINEAAVSQAEHTCLFLEAASDATFVGSATHGANGNVTEVALPGGMMVRFTGLDVRHADGRQLQRVGILPHLEVHPTIAGIRAGRDEVLEAAVAYLQAGTPRPPG